MPTAEAAWENTHGKGSRIGRTPETSCTGAVHFFKYLLITFMGLAIAVVTLAIPATGRAGGIGEYTTSGTTVNASLITGLTGPYSIAVSGSNLFVGVVAVPEPSGLLLVATGLVGLAIRRRHARGASLG